MNLKKAIKDYWESRDEQNLQYFGDVRYTGGKIKRYWIETLLEQTSPDQETTTFLDVGCAEGYFVHQMSARVKLAIGVDVSLSLLKKARDNVLGLENSRRESIELVLADAENLPFAERSIDTVMCSEVLEHLLDWKRSVQELVRVCRQHLIISFPPHTQPFELLVEQIRGVDPRPGEDFFSSTVTLPSLLDEIRGAFRIEEKINSHAVCLFVQSFYVLSALNALLPPLARALAFLLEMLDRKLDVKQNRVLELFSGSIILRLQRVGH